jgi:hypothetical protein
LLDGNHCLRQTCSASKMAPNRGNLSFGIGKCIIFHVIWDYMNISFVSEFSIWFDIQLNGDLFQGPSAVWSRANRLICFLHPSKIPLIHKYHYSSYLRSRHRIYTKSYRDTSIAVTLQKCIPNADLSFDPHFLQERSGWCPRIAEI